MESHTPRKILNETLHAQDCDTADRRTRPSDRRLFRGLGRGMTLVEVLAVVVILGLIATTLTVSFRGQLGRAKRELAKTGVGIVVAAVESYGLEMGGLPTMEQGLQALTVAPQGRGEPFLRADKLTDPWGNPYQYIIPGPNSAYQVLSFGADGRPGGASGSEDEDITSDNLGAAPRNTTSGAGGGS